jgi:hypothetical protein
MNRWIIAAALGAMAVPVFGQNAANEPKPDTAPSQPPATISVRVIGAKPESGQVPVFVDNALQGAVNQRVERAPLVPPGPTAAAHHEKVPYLGVITSSAAPAMREQLKLGKGGGLVVDLVEAGTAAETAGVKQHDVIEKLNDQLLINTEQLTALLRSMKAGDEVTLSIIRQGERQSLKAKLGEKEINTGGMMANFTPAALPAMPMGVPGRVRIMGNGNGGRVVVEADDGAIMGGVPMGMGNVLIRTLDGKQTTEWADDQFRIKLERDGDKTTRVTVTDVKSGKVVFTGAPPAADDPIFKTLPQLQEKLKSAQDAAVQPPLIINQMGAAMGARGKVVRWQDDHYILIMRVMGTKPIYLLALSKKDGRTLYDGPVMTDEQRSSIPAEVSEQFQLLGAHPEQIKEFGGNEPKK